ncbi:lysosomal alpha-mannosidase-like [Eupeodes corollae]|uniref:lysosomal alpha-mannosidase-like n=1 Tax=Eupeodes corollae TaxID=290404 RepID=UPI00248F5000|nr:lysosomal alpha-mannosidase-like [Eupeodes corollae]
MAFKPVAALVLCAVILAVEIADTEAKCGYKSCPASPTKYTNIHLVPHSHDDVEWLKTVDQYYYGSKTGIQRAGVQYILDSVIDELQKERNRRFIYVESAFFFKWWDEQSSSTQKIVKKLVNDGQLEFTGGAWSMNDEAAVHYQSVIDQFTIGLKRLDETFGECGRPKVGWQIDPFGHSRQMASTFAEMGFDGEFFARMDWVEKNLRLKNISAEMIWKASPSLGESSELFTGLLYNHYSAPPGFCFDTLCQDDPIIDGKSADNNVNKKVEDFLDYTKNMSAYYKTNNLMIPMGDDFNYQSAGINFKNMDKLIKYVNERQKFGSKVNIFYSTPSCYLKSLYDDLQTWPTKTEDFLPYSTDWHSYWTGYYSSRPTQKRYERVGNHFLQVCKQLTTFAKLSSASAKNNLDNLRHAMGVMQHHDAITGTEKQKVAQDYDKLLHGAIFDCENNTREALQKLTNLTKGEFESCHLSNISVCSLSSKADSFSVTLFNALGKISTQNVRIPISNGTYVVSDKSGNIIPSEVVPVAWSVLKIPYRRNVTQHELVFTATVINIQTIYVKRISKPKIQDKIVPEWFAKFRSGRGSPVIVEKFYESRATKAPNQPKLNNFTVENSNIRLNFSSTGHLVAIKMNGIDQKIRQDFFYYRGASGNNAEFKNRSSGAYIFRPNGTEVAVATKVNLNVIKGKLVQEVHQIFNDWISQVIRIYNNTNRVEFEWLIGPIPIDDKVGKEVITKFTSPINSKGVFYTDSNGRDMMKRIRNHREKFTANLTERVSGNYYPITSRIALEDEKTRLAILNDRAQGGSSIENGSLELMLHRRLLNDDAFGVGEALNETAYGQGLVARGKYYLVISPPKKESSIVERQIQLEVLLPFWNFFSSNGTDSKVQVPLVPSFNSLPTGIHLLTIEPWSDTEILLRLEHFLDISESSKISFSIRPIFIELGGSKIRETTLDGSMALSDMKRLKFVEQGAKVKKNQYIKAKHIPLKASKKDKDPAFVVSFEPMQIRTFVIKIDK